MPSPSSGTPSARPPRPARSAPRSPQTARPTDAPPQVRIALHHQQRPQAARIKERHPGQVRDQRAAVIQSDTERIVQLMGIGRIHLTHRSHDPAVTPPHRRDTQPASRHGAHRAITLVHRITHLAQLTSGSDHHWSRQVCRSARVHEASRTVYVCTRHPHSDPTDTRRRSPLQHCVTRDSRRRANRHGARRNKRLQPSERSGARPECFGQSAPCLDAPTNQTDPDGVKQKPHSPRREPRCPWTSHPIYSRRPKRAR